MNEFFVYALLALFFVAYAALFSPCYLSVCEWLLHSQLMHKAVKWFMYPFRTHAQTHHGLFKADATYHLQAHDNPEESDHKITMAAWNAPIITFVPALPFLILAIFTSWWSLFWIPYVAAWLYYGTYETLHYFMHLPELPEPRWIERQRIFKFLNGHHILHHRFPHKNFNVVFPFADWCFGTLVSRSHIPFPQPRGPAVPDVQPRAVT